MVVKLCEHYNVQVETEIKAAGYEPSNVRSTYVEGGPVMLSMELLLKNDLNGSSAKRLRASPSFPAAATST